MSKTPLLMTGASGLVGSRFVEMFGDTYEIYNLDLTTGVDITSKESVAHSLDAHPAKAMIHLAAFTDTNKAFAESGDKTGLCYRVNVEGTANLAAAAKERGIHLVHISTDFVFDGTKESPYTEDDPTSPIEWYGETKAEAEGVVARSGATYAIARLSYPYRREFEPKPDIVKKIRLGLESGKLYPQFTDSVITPTFIDDIARGLDAILRQSATGIYHLTGSTSLSPYALAVQVATAFGFDPSVVKEGSLTEYLRSASRPFARHVAMSNAKATAELGVQFATLEQGLAALT